MREQLAASGVATIAFARLLERWQGPLRAFARGILGNDELARDTVQDAFCDAWRASRRGSEPFAHPEDEEGARRWLYNATYCRAVSALRRGSLITWESLDRAQAADRIDPPERAAFEDAVAEAQALRAALDTLAPEDVACLLLSVVHGFTTAEIAQIVGIQHEAAKKRLARAKQRLRSAYLASSGESSRVHGEHTL